MSVPRHAHKLESKMEQQQSSAAAAAAHFKRFNFLNLLFNVGRTQRSHIYMYIYLRAVIAYRSLCVLFNSHTHTHTHVSSSDRDYQLTTAQNTILSRTKSRSYQYAKELR